MNSLLQCAAAMLLPLLRCANSRSNVLSCNSSNTSTTCPFRSDFSPVRAVREAAACQRLALFEPVSERWMQQRQVHLSHHMPFCSGCFRLIFCLMSHQAYCLSYPQLPRHRTKTRFFKAESARGDKLSSEYYDREHAQRVQHHEWTGKMSLEWQKTLFKEEWFGFCANATDTNDVDTVGYFTVKSIGIKASGVEIAYHPSYHEPTDFITCEKMISGEVIRILPWRQQSHRFKCSKCNTIAVTRVRTLYVICFMCSRVVHSLIYTITCSRMGETSFVRNVRVR